jgi:hypothetical protein
MSQLSTDNRSGDIVWGGEALPGRNWHALDRLRLHLAPQEQELTVSHCYGEPDARGRVQFGHLSDVRYPVSVEVTVHQRLSPKPMVARPTQPIHLPAAINVKLYVGASLWLSLQPQDNVLLDIPAAQNIYVPARLGANAIPDVNLHISLLLPFAQGAFTLLLGWLLVRLVLKLSQPFLDKNFDRHQRILTERLICWLLMTLFIITALNQAGFEFGVYLGAAGKLSVAIGFASQTSVANLISGLFVVGERSISVGDTVQLGAYTGELLSIDWLSIKLRTFDKRFVRIPNESFIKSDVINLSQFPLGRVDMPIHITQPPSSNENTTT